MTIPTLQTPDVWTFIILGLATYRVSRLIVLDTFPPVEKFREWFKHHWPDTGDIVQRPPKRGFVQPNAPHGTDPRDIERFRVINGTSLGYLISCMYCTPFWVALVWLALWEAFPSQTTICASLFALAADGTLVYRWEQR